MACDENKNPLIRGGTSQQQRQLAAMQKNYILIDEHDYAQWIAFADQFSEYVRYYDTNGSTPTNWKPFFENDISAVLGSFAIQNVNDYKEALNERFKFLRSNDLQNNITKKKENLGALFAAVFTLCKALDYYLVKLPQGNPLKTSIQNLIHTKLQPTLQKLLGYYKGGKSLALIKERDYPDWKVLNFGIGKAGTIISEGLSLQWTRNTSNWVDFYTIIDADESIYGDPAWDDHRRINHAANHNLFSSLFDQFLLYYSKILTEAEKGLLQTLTEWNEHQPHYALFLAFLKLFRFARDHANTLTQRHLDFYYKEVLRLMPQKALPNQAHIIVELAKHIDNYLLVQGTKFKAGKDSLGKEVLYALDKDVVFNKAKVAALMTVYRGSESDNYFSKENNITVKNNNRLFASPIANSANGLGGKFTTANKEWHPYINKKYTDGTLSAITMPKADIGFAIASHYLFLTEGERLVNVKFSPAFTATQLTALQRTNCYLSTEKEWYYVTNTSWKAGTLTSKKQDASVLTFTLSGEVAAISNYNQKVHGGTLNLNLPVLKVMLKNEDASPFEYDALKNIVLNTVEIEVKVGVNDGHKDTLNAGGLKNLLLYNDVSILDPSKPILPFGNAPKVGASFIAGNEEVFKKKNAAVQFSAEWMELPSASNIAYPPGSALPKTSFQYLAQSIWKPVLTHDILIADSPEVLFPSSMVPSNNETTLPYAESYLPYSVLSKSGFIKLTLNAGFGHDEYQKAYTEYLIEIAKPKPAPPPPVLSALNITNTVSLTATDIHTSLVTRVVDFVGSGAQPPYTPKLKSISLHYKAFTVTNLTAVDEESFAGRELQFIHLYPFGNKEEHQFLTKKTATFLPQFLSPLNETTTNTGEFYVGLKDLLAGQNVQVLFQFLDGSSNPLLDKPDEHVSWSYLSQNKWIGLKDQEFTDQTRQMIQSGIISFVVPAQADTDNTLMPSGYIWLRASVSTYAEAVCKLLSVQAQAASVTFHPNENAPDFLDKALPAGTILKLKEPVAAIKKIEQPYSSFGGRANENNQQYYLRASERLRHKSRAITIWDYERLVLEAFPSIHKVKCLNHTKFIDADYNEIAPGHVTIITIPNLINRNDANPLRPYTNQDILNEIEEFLKKKISCHVKLKVRHPQFEEVRLGFSLKLISGLEFNFYSNLLQQEISEFLTPWAFGKTSDIGFGGQIYKSVLINFIEERSYVNYITDVKIYHRVDDKEREMPDTVVASTAKSILVSAPPLKHTITNEDAKKTGRGERKKLHL